MKLPATLLVSFLLVVLAGSKVSAQATDSVQIADGWTEARAARVAKMHLAYYWAGFAFPGNEYAPRYGFDLDDAGCMGHPFMMWHNWLVVARVNRVYGWRWFQKHRSEIAYGYRYNNK